jgi:hypothetical protein
MTAKTLTIRLQPDIYKMASTLAQRRHMSLNRLFQEGLDLLIAQDHEKQLFDDFSLIADTGTDELDVEFALSAQTQATPEQ